VLNERGDELAIFLDQAARLSGDVADILEANKPFLEKAVTEGGKTIQVLSDNRARLGPTIRGLRQFFQVLSEAGRIPRSDGTMMAAVKLVFGESCPMGRLEGCGESITPQAQAQAAAAAANVAPTSPVLPTPQSGTDGLLQLLGGLLP
jgi:ABC-type transporter Mla subunit MlaD